MIVYRFKSLKSESKEHAFDIIRNKRVYLEDWDKLNDPIEGYFSFWDNAFSIKVSDKKKAYRVCSFSRYYANSLLWSYYADGFKGICIALHFDDSELQLHEVKYLKRVPEFEKWDERTIDEIAKDALSSKLNYWRHESEVRLIEPKEMLDEGRYVSCSIAGVFYGSLIGENDREDLLDLCSKLNIGHAEVQMNPDSGLSSCHAVSNNVTLMNRIKLPSIEWINLGAGSLQGWTHQGERVCQICSEPDLNDPCDPFGLPGFLEDHIIDPQAYGGIHDPNNTALLCPSCHKRLHLDTDFTAKHRDKLRFKNRNNR